MSKKAMNQAQQEAVAYVDGPLLIVAGAGTGKTTVITEKIHHIISSGLAKPEEILALTFTEKAAQEMQERVDMLLDTGYVDISISTFHAFCQKLIETYGLDIGVSNQPTLLTEIDAWLLVRKHLSTFDLSYYRPLGNPNRHIHELLSHFSKCKDELITPEQYLAYAQEVALNKDSAEQADASRLTELANAYHRYNQLLLDTGAMDFGDLLVYSVRLLEERPQIKKQIQQRYKYILVDEFQDVNWAQYHLVHLLSEVSQLTVVGDDDQSIYAFRGASVSNILRFQEDYPTAKQIVLQENYRSGQKILDISYQSIQNNNPDRLEEKLHINKKLIAAGASYTGQVHHLHAATMEEEVKQVIETIRQLKQDTDIAWHDIAILFRANSAAAPFMHGLEAAGIPYEYMASSGLFRQSIVLDCINFFISISDVHHNAALFRLLHIPSVSISDADIQQLIFGAKKKSISYYDALSRSGSFHVSEEGQKKYQQLLQYLHAAMQRARSEKPTTVLYQFLEESGYLHYLTISEGGGNEEILKQIQYLKQFFDFVSNYETTQPDTHVADIVEYYGHISEAGDDGKLYQPSDMRDAVNLLTIHASKGLEYRCVFVVNMVEDR
ncbi:MAG: ATP-dependent helicase, partial [Candidatus Magasanikbacteria bacterium]|nr:ATP-dependent helicase [Candidatus Magasanikbacteria bacterium]